MASYNDTIPAAVRLIMGDPDYDVIWRQAKTLIRKPEHVDLRLAAIRRIGVDEVRTKVVPSDHGALQETISGNRSVVIEFSCESDQQGAQAIADALVMGFQQNDVRELLTTSNLGAGQIGPVMDACYPDDDGDTIDQVIFEITFPTTVTRTGATIQRVKTVIASGTVQPGDVPIGPVTVTHDET